MVRLKSAQSVSTASASVGGPTTRFSMELGETAARCPVATGVAPKLGAPGSAAGLLPDRQRVQLCRGLQVLAELSDFAPEQKLSGGHQVLQLGPGLLVVANFLKIEVPVNNNESNEQTMTGVLPPHLHHGQEH